MSDTIHLLVERYGLIAIFFGCVAEGESAAILAGFFAHQRIFGVWEAYAATFVGAFAGDVMFFLTGRRFADTGFVTRLRQTPGFNRALQLVKEHPATYVVLNRYAYGFRLIGGVAAGMSGIAFPKFLVLNALSSAIWAALFCSVGYLFGLGAETIVGAALAKHERLLIGLMAGLVVAALAWGLAHLLRRRAGIG